MPTKGHLAPNYAYLGNTTPGQAIAGRRPQYCYGMHPQASCLSGTAFPKDIHVFVVLSLDQKRLTTSERRVLKMSDTTTMHESHPLCFIPLAKPRAWHEARCNILNFISLQVTSKNLYRVRERRSSLTNQPAACSRSRSGSAVPTP